jgi:hypothetical protein
MPEISVLKMKWCLCSHFSFQREFFCPVLSPVKQAFLEQFIVWAR